MTRMQCSFAPLVISVTNTSKLCFLFYGSCFDLKMDDVGKMFYRDLKAESECDFICRNPTEVKTAKMVCACVWISECVFVKILMSNKQITISPCPITRCAFPLKLICRPLSLCTSVCPASAASVSVLFGIAQSVLSAPVSVCVCVCLHFVFQMFIR